MDSPAFQELPVPTPNAGVLIPTGISTLLMLLLDLLETLAKIHTTEIGLLVRPSLKL